MSYLCPDLFTLEFVVQGPKLNLTVCRMLQFRWTGLDNPFAETANAFAREIRADLAATSGYSGLTTYVSYAYGDESLEQKFGRDKLPRLLKLKEKWDPENRFGYCNPLVDPTQRQ